MAEERFGIKINPQDKNRSWLLFSSIVFIFMEKSKIWHMHAFSLWELSDPQQERLTDTQ